jgi:UDP-N-acetylglucosamine 2-epimerase (non-hydrolysing)
MTAVPDHHPVLELIAGARPNFVKLAPVVHALRRVSALRVRVVHTGQHFDASMSDVFFEELGMAPPDVHLGVGGGSSGAQTARILQSYEAHLLAHRPTATVVFGDVDSTMACALAAVKLGVPVAHVEAGLRSFDRSMPEEINRIVTDAIADLLLVSEPAGIRNLAREGVPPDKVRIVGNVMIDSLYAHLTAARLRPAAAELGIHGPAYGFVTMHRPANVDDREVLEPLLHLFQKLATELPLIFAVHPRTAASASRFGLAAALRPGQHPWICVPAVSYLDSISLVAGATLVVTDSGGLQEETAVLKVPCLTLRANTERPITVERGTSRLLGHDVRGIETAFHDVLEGRWPAGQEIPLWDGHAGERVAAALASWIGVET